MAVSRVLKGGFQYVFDNQTLLRLGFTATSRRACAAPVSLGLNPCVCHYATKDETSEIPKKEKRSIENDENNPDHFGNLRNSFIEPSKLAKSRRTNVNKSYQQRSANNKLHPKSLDVADKPKETDVFGTIGEPLRLETDDLPTDDEGDKLEEEYQRRIRPKPWQTIKNFAGHMRKHIRERRLGDALALFKEMKQTYIIQPDAYMFNVLIGGCGRAGYTQMAFKLYKEMRERNLQPDGSTFTGLFNSCATSPFPEEGLKNATRLYEKITEKGISLNAKTYHAAIKAFGRVGNLQMAFHLVDEMAIKGVGVTTETFNFLLAACASDHDSGFLQAIRVWKKMKTKKLQPDLYSYDLLLRVVRDCNMGDPQVAEQLLFSKNLLDNYDSKRLQIPQHHSINVIPTNAVSFPETRLPDILSPTSTAGSVMALQGAENASKRLLMLGGVYGIVHRMKMDKVQPRVKTFTELLEIIPDKEKEEEFLLEIMSERKVRPDIDFFNILIKKRNKRGDFESAKNVLQLIAKNSLHLDIATFGTLAMGCHDWKDAKLLLHDMNEAGFRPNIQIMGALANRACSTKNFWYLIDVLNLIRENEIQASPKLIELLETTVISTKKYIVEKEKQGITFKENDHFYKSFKVFMLYYKKWLQDMEIELPNHPWEAYGYESVK